MTNLPLSLALVSVLVTSPAWAGGVSDVSRVPRATEPIVTNSRNLSRTVVTADFDQVVTSDLNYVFSCGINLAWNQLATLNQTEGVPLDVTDPLVDVLNRGEFKEDLIPMESCLADAVAVSQDSIETINRRLHDKFTDPPMVQIEQSTDAAIFAFAYIVRDMSFQTPFEATLEVCFQGLDTPAFGFDGIEKADKYSPQFVVPYYNEKQHECVVILNTKDSNDQLILGMIAPQSTLRSSYERIVELSRGRPEDPRTFEKLAIPKINHRIDHEWIQLIGKVITAGDHARTPLLAAQTFISFRLDEKGAGIEDFSYVYGAKGIPKDLIFDRPFMIILKRADRDLPYFVEWVGNSELLLKYHDTTSE